MQELATKVNARTEVIKDGETQVVKARLYMEKARGEQAAEIHKLFKEVGSPLFYRPFHPNIAKKIQTFLAYFSILIEDSIEL